MIEMIDTIDTIDTINTIEKILNHPNEVTLYSRSITISLNHSIINKCII